MTCQDPPVQRWAASDVRIDLGAAGTVVGTVAPGFEAVRDAFVANFTEHGDTGASVCVLRDGVSVVDLAGGWARVTDRVPYDQRTLQLVFSATKGATALAAHLLAQRGQLDLDAPVASLWPAFAAAGKEQVPVRWLLTHQAGLPTVDAAVTLEQALAWQPVVDALAAQAPLWTPGTAHGYHALTFGWLVGEVVRRASGRSVGRLLADEVAGPLGIDLYVGLPAHLRARVAPLRSARVPMGRRRDPGGHPQDPNAVRVWVEMLRPGSLGVRALTLNGAFGSFGRRGPFNTDEVLAAEVPAANGVTNARSLATMYAAMLGEVHGVRLLGDAQRAAAATPQVTGPDRVLVVDTCFGLGYQCAHPANPLLGPGSFGHAGAGGALAFAHPDSQVAFAYVMNQLRFGIAGDDRSGRLVAALAGCL